MNREVAVATHYSWRQTNWARFTWCAAS